MEHPCGIEWEFVDLRYFGKEMECSIIKKGIWGRKGVIQMWAERMDSLYPRIHYNLGMLKRRF